MSEVEISAALTTSIPSLATHLQSLVNDSLLDAQKTRKGLIYSLAEKGYGVSGEGVPQTTEKGTGYIEQVLNYLEAHGRITRREAIEICDLTPDQASRLLTNMVKKGLTSETDCVEMITCEEVATLCSIPANR